MSASDGSDGKAYGLHVRRGGSFPLGIQGTSSFPWRKMNGGKKRSKGKKEKKGKRKKKSVLPSFTLQFLSYFIINFFDDSRTEPGTCWSLMDVTDALSLPSLTKGPIWRVI